MQDLGEDAFPDDTVQPAPADDREGDAKTVEKVEPPSSALEVSTASSHPQEPKKEERTNVTTEQRIPFDIPTSVHVRINSGNLKEYVGPPVYHKDRLYITPPPAGVSTGLGYSGNGSGAVMPVEVTVSV